MQIWSHLSKSKPIKLTILGLLGVLVLGWLVSTTGWLNNLVWAAAPSPAPAKPALQESSTAPMQSSTAAMQPQVQTAASSTATGNSPAATAQALSQAFRDAANKVMPAVVTIQHTIPAAKTAASGNLTNELKNSPFRDFFNNPELRRFFQNMPEMPSRPEVSMGSGVIIDKSGIVLTNDHVVDGGGNLEVKLPDGRKFETSAIKTDPDSDLAVVTLKDARDLPFAQLGNSDQLQIGDWVIAVGNPFGLSDTVTAGIISAKGRGLGEREVGFLQTDAPINPGNSGGPLVNLNGEVVGIDTAISTTSGGYQGVGFAIPINFAKWVSEELIAHGKVERAYLGVGIQQITPELATHLGLKENQRGVVVTNVFPNTPGSRAGLKTGDIIVKFAGQPVSSPQRLKEMVEESKLGSRQNMEVLRDQKPLDLTVTLKEMPSGYGQTAESSEEGGRTHGTVYKDLGIHVAPLTAEEESQLGMTNMHGVLITSVDPGSPAAEAGLASNMVISEVGHTPVKNMEEFRAAMDKQSLKKGILLLANSKQGSMFVVLQVG
jgi:serine protease Do